MKIITERIALDELKQIAAGTFDDMVKAVVDIERGLIALDAELHSDLEARLLEDGSRQDNLWGINLYPGAPRDQLVEFDSMINMRPSQGNKSRGVENEAVRQKIITVVDRRIPR